MNIIEQKLKKQLEAENPDCDVLQNGWPDFIVIEKVTGKIRKAVECKSVGTFPEPHQEQCHRALRASGIKTEVHYECGSGFIVKEK